MADNTNDNMVTLGGMWINKSKSGETYMAGPFGLSKLMLFKNKNKVPGSTSPDYFLCVVPGKPKKEEVLESDHVPF